MGNKSNSNSNSRKSVLKKLIRKSNNNNITASSSTSASTSTSALATSNDSTGTGSGTGNNNNPKPQSISDSHNNKSTSTLNTNNPKISKSKTKSSSLSPIKKSKSSTSISISSPSKKKSKKHILSGGTTITKTPQLPSFEDTTTIPKLPEPLQKMPIPAHTLYTRNKKTGAVQRDAKKAHRFSFNGMRKTHPDLAGGVLSSILKNKNIKNDTLATPTEASMVTSNSDDDKQQQEGGAEVSTSSETKTRFIKTSVKQGAEQARRAAAAAAESTNNNASSTATTLKIKSTIPLTGAVPNPLQPSSSSNKGGNSGTKTKTSYYPVNTSNIKPEDVKSMINNNTIKKQNVPIKFRHVMPIDHKDSNTANTIVDKQQNQQEQHTTTKNIEKNNRVMMTNHPNAHSMQQQHELYLYNTLNNKKPRLSPELKVPNYHSSNSATTNKTTSNKISMPSSYRRPALPSMHNTLTTQHRVPSLSPSRSNNELYLKTPLTTNKTPPALKLPVGFTQLPSSATNTNHLSTANNNNTQAHAPQNNSSLLLLPSESDDALYSNHWATWSIKSYNECLSSQLARQYCVQVVKQTTNRYAAILGGDKNNIIGLYSTPDEAVRRAITAANVIQDLHPTYPIEEFINPIDTKTSSSSISNDTTITNTEKTAKGERNISIINYLQKKKAAVLIPPDDIDEEKSNNKITSTTPMAMDVVDDFLCDDSFDDIHDDVDDEDFELPSTQQQQRSTPIRSMPSTTPPSSSSIPQSSNKSKKRLNNNNKSSPGYAFGKPRACQIININTGEIIQNFKSVGEAERITRVNRSWIGKICRQGGGVLEEKYFQFIPGTTTSTTTGVEDNVSIASNTSNLSNRKSSSSLTRNNSITIPQSQISRTTSIDTITNKQSSKTNTNTPRLYTLDKTLCIICQTKHSNIIFDPCEHCIICEDCVMEGHCSKFCPLCRCCINKRKKIVMNDDSDSSGLKSFSSKTIRPRIFSYYHMAFDDDGNKQS